MSSEEDLIPATMHDLHLGVVAGKGIPGESFNVNRPVVFGTAFPIGPGLFMTAAHVLRDARADAGLTGQVALFRRDIEAGQVQREEPIPGLDLALLMCPYFEHLLPLPVSFEPLSIFSNVSAAGYPLAVDAERLVLNLRGFAGHIVTRRELYHLPAQPPGYELSFPSPRGLSGAPLISTNRQGSWCCGVMIENWRYASGDFTAGLAVASEAFQSVESAILKRPLAELFGTRHKPLLPPTPVRNPNMVPFDISGDDWPEG